MLESKKKYIFSEYHKKQLIPAIQHKVLAFDIQSFMDKAIKITIDKSLLPRYCRLELVEEALSSLEKKPDNTELLKALVKYTENDIFDKLGYRLEKPTLIASYTLGLCLSANLYLKDKNKNLMSDIALLLMVTSPIAILYAIDLFDLIKAPAKLKLSRWIGNLVKGTYREPNNLKELEDKLMNIMSQGKNNEQTLSSTLEIQEDQTESQINDKPVNHFR